MSWLLRPSYICATARCGGFFKPDTKTRKCALCGALYPIIRAARKNDGALQSSAWNGLCGRPLGGRGFSFQQLDAVLLVRIQFVDEVVEKGKHFPKRRLREVRSL